MKVWIAVATWFLISCSVAFAVETSFCLKSFDVSSYNSFIIQLRARLAIGGNTSYGIPVMPSEKKFIVTCLEFEGIPIILALDGTTADLVAYSVYTNSYFFSDVSVSTYTGIFNETTKHRLPFGGTYKGLEVAGAYREKVPLGGTQLEEALLNLIKYPTKPDTDIAKAFLVIVQMVSEAARLELVTARVTENYDNGYYPGCNVISVENTWKSFSIAFQTTDSFGHFSPLLINNDDCSPFTAVSVVQVKVYYGLFQNTTTPKSSFQSSMAGDSIKMLNAMF